ncbi:hypothetical protein FPG87_12465 [Flavobacterium psychrophilum]|uniref:DUF4468 domain-containing protein n=1 Tax=Flavobacterium psychrophilum TaxID=96345 RepID=A0A7U2NHI8_FLAPS|nr:hypothetical protein [Flavobacterium psychrophilum]MBF2091271.1 hypothetical protein [Flavobacterium psychrophilum]OAE92151.1 hypothetical protein SU65_10375 [Flavobacterium psychrophilum]OJH10055.1 hypothetical protein FPG87_12465 [Flavobacterium psychrophilum]QRE05306.1 hypothetical protein H0H26_06890 [Flavobacterium psychrophilum]SNA67051.1 hypothetical protein DK150_170022 [Flavobacterium psychrophilum]
MKKLLLLIVITLFSFTGFAQKIYPFYPNLPIDDYQYLTQITYYDLNHVSNRITKFLYANNNMDDVPDKNIYNLKDGVGTITMPYIEMSSRGKQSKLLITYDLFKIDGEFVIKSLKITGDYDKMVPFYVTFWNTEINVEKNRSITNNFVQDLITFNNNIQNPIITVTNTTISDTNKFATDFLNKKKLEQSQTINSEGANLEIINKNKVVESERKVEVVENKRIEPIITSEKVILKVKKRKGNFMFDSEISDLLKEKIKKYYYPYQDFNCTITVTYDAWDNKIKDDSFFCVSSDCN